MQTGEVCFLFVPVNMQIAPDWKKKKKYSTSSHYVLFGLHPPRRTHKDTCEQTPQQRGNLIRADVLGSLAEEHETWARSGCAKTNAAEAPANNLIPESAVLNKVSLGCALVSGGSVSHVLAGRPAVCVSVTLLYRVSEKSRVQTELHASCSLYSHFAFEYGAKSVRPLFKNTLQHDCCSDTRLWITAEKNIQITTQWRHPEYRRTSFLGFLNPRCNCILWHKSKQKGKKKD